jgi:transcriptional regulator with XRE-family HTH domain
VSIQPVLPGLEAFISEAEAERTTGLRAHDLVDRYEKHLRGALEKNGEGQLEFDMGTIAQIERAETNAGNISPRSRYRGGMTQRALAEHLGLTVGDLRQLRDAGLLANTHNGKRPLIGEKSWRALIQYIGEMSVFLQCDPTEYDSSIEVMSLSKFRKLSRVGILKIIENIERGEIECFRYSNEINSFYDLLIDAKPFKSRLRRRPGFSLTVF